MPSLEYIGSKLAMSAVKPVMSKVSSLFEKEADHIWKVDDKFMKLRVTYHITQTMLSKLDSCNINETTLEPLLNDLDRYCYDIEDIVDDLDLSFATKEDDQNPVRSYIIKSLRLTIPHQIGELQEKLQGLNSLIEQLLSAGAIALVQSQNGGRALYSKSLYDKTPLVPGTRRDQDKQMVISQLISQQSEHCGVSIIGMDGLGKTSLARTILLDQSTKERFPIILSACVSGEFEMDDVVQKLVHGYSTRTEQQIPLTLEQIVGSTESLIILDDIASVTDEEWDRFISNNLSSSPGWKILTTTRNPNVAEVTKSNPFYLERMTDEDCKKLIVDRAMLSKFECESWSDDIEVIAKKCMGIPLLANKVGLKLSKKKIGVERKKFIMQLKMEKLWDLQEFREVFPSLNLNEPKLPPDLKRCFSYCSLFPTSHEFNKDELIQLWEVEGMNHCFEDLLSRSILQPFRSRDKKQTVYKMHEFNHEFAHLLASKAICRLEETNLLSYARSLRHLSLTCHNTDKTLLEKIEECEGLRTFLLLHQSKPKTRVISYNFFQKLHRLRLLDLSHTNISNLPKSKFPSKHLRFLDLSYSSITKLPESVCSMRALRILKLKGCSGLLQLPNDLHHLTNLTHLHVNMKVLGFLPSNIGKLTKLEVLDSFLVGEDDSCKVVELQDMKNLKEIHIFGLENIKDTEEAQNTMLSEKLLLRILVLQWDSLTAMNASNVLKGLEPHNHLEDLTVRNYTGKDFPTWLVSPFCQIVSLNLENCPNCEVLPSLSQLPVLKNLVFRSIHNVKTVDDQFCGEAERVYPCLESLEFHDMSGLVSWSGLKSGDMPHLCSLKIINCPMLISLPSFKHLGNLIYLEINKCPELISLPELPSSMNSHSGVLVIIYSPLVALSCEPEGADWPKIKDIPYVEIGATRVIPQSSIPSQENIKDKLSMDEHQPFMLVNGNSVTQTGENESRSNKSKGKQKVDEGSSSNQVKVAHTPPQNQLPEQPEDGETKNEDHVNSLLHQSTTIADTNFLLPSKVDNVKVLDSGKHGSSDPLKSPQKPSPHMTGPPKHPKGSKRRFSQFFRRHLCGCFSPVE